MFNRLAQARLHALAQQFPAVLILGARQVGKTTLARQSFPDHLYVDLESPGARERFGEDPVFQLQVENDRGLILDEAQTVPAIFPALRGLIDADRRRRGRYILLGSAQPALVSAVSESLAGRIGILELDPLAAFEVAAGDFGPHEASARAVPPGGVLEHIWLHGGFPDAFLGDFREWHENYLRTYVERDLPALGLPHEPVFARRLLTMLAHQQGGLLNVSTLANALGVGHAKVARWLDVLEQTFLIRRLPPYFRNVGKRLVKSPKVYLRDTGMLHHLLNIGRWDTLCDHPVLGASWEAFVIEDLLRREKLASPHSQAYFWRTGGGAEIDLVIDRGDHLAVVETKSGYGNATQARRLAEAMGDLGCEQGWIVDRARESSERLNPFVTRRSFGSDLSWRP